MKIIVTHCLHCRQPPCLRACPEDAITKRDDGVVLFDARVCPGCIEMLSDWQIRLQAARRGMQK